MYGSEAERLTGYYDFIHDYFPILPPRVSSSRYQPLHGPMPYSGSPSQEPLMEYRPRSPLSLAISSVLALVTHPSDPEPSSTASTIRSRTYAHTSAQAANSAIETECDLDLSSIDPGQVLSTAQPFVARERFHHRTPVDLESLLALLVLSVYEYSQRGNMIKMRSRAGQALEIALEKSLHVQRGNDEFSEARRRAWWMTYYCVTQGSIVRTTPPAIVINNPQFTTPYPSFSSDSEGWHILIPSQQVLVSATQFIANLNKSSPSQSSLQNMFEQMRGLDAWTDSLLAQADSPPIFLKEPEFGHQETTTAQSIRAIAQIKISSAKIKTHRFRAFSDIPIFIKRHCDLTAANPSTPTPNSSSTGINTLTCSCSKMEPPEQAPSCEYSTPPNSIAFNIQPTTPEDHPQYLISPQSPYSTQDSTKTCLHAALEISRMFESLPIPQPLDSQQQRIHPRRPLPRTMPPFACCLMQSSYVLFMIFYNTRVVKQLFPQSEGEHTGALTDTLMEQLRQGLQRIIATVSNYSLAFEALDGMRDLFVLFAHVHPVDILFD